MKNKVKYLKDLNEAQLKVEKSLIDNIKPKIPKALSGRTRGIKFPKYIWFNIKDETLFMEIREETSININPVCNKNMQDDNAAFEGWAICLKSWLKNIKKVELSWDIPSKELLLKGKLHYNRFFYRVMRFQEAFSDWFSVSDKNRIEIIDFQTKFKDLKNNAFSKKPEHKRNHNDKFGESDLEFALVTEFYKEMTSSFNLDFIDRQFPVGLKKDNKQFFTGGLSAIDLWGTKDDIFSLLELKYKNNKVGIISEIFLYSCVVRDIIKGKIEKPSTSIPKENEINFYNNAKNFKKINAYMFANEYHPLIENEKVFNLLNHNEFEDISISFRKCSYKYDEKSKTLINDKNYESEKI